MPHFGRASRSKLSTCDDRLVAIANRAIEVIDFSILCGERTFDEQWRLYRRGLSKVKPPNSKHNTSPSRAFDFAPWPIDWQDTRRFHIVAGVLFAIARNERVTIRWGGDWDGDWDLNDQTFNDLGHIELVDP